MAVLPFSAGAAFVHSFRTRHGLFVVLLAMTVVALFAGDNLT
jgi:hypothetical protein